MANVYSRRKFWRSAFSFLGLASLSGPLNKIVSAGPEHKSSLPDQDMPDDDRGFADFHIHGSFKGYCTHDEVAFKKSPWERVKIKYIDRLFLKYYNKIFVTQSCFQQLYDGNMRLCIMPMYSLEWAVASDFFIRIAGGIEQGLNSKLLQKVRSKELTNFEQFKSCYHHLLRAKKDLYPGAGKVNFMRTFVDFKPGMINIVFSIEGTHSLWDFGEDGGRTKETLDVLKERIALLKRKIPGPDNLPRVFAINFTHMTKTPLCNHAMGMKFLPHSDFTPQGNGMTHEGEIIVRAMMRHDDDHYPMLIDVKHMSLDSRKELYTIRKKEFRHLPVLASHAACTGFSWKDIGLYGKIKRARRLTESDQTGSQNSAMVWGNPTGPEVGHYLVDYVYDVDGLLKGTKFNPWSINLYDEDIVEILTSGGVIGLTLDQRLLGSGDVGKEKISMNETWGLLERIDKLQIQETDYIPGEPEPVGDSISHIRHFCNNLFHIIKIGSELDKNDQGDRIDPWKSVVIGSDFDGFIDPIDLCLTAKDFPKLRQGLLQSLPGLAAEAGIDLPRSKEDLVQGLLYQNGFDFLKKHF